MVIYPVVICCLLLIYIYRKLKEQSLKTLKLKKIPTEKGQPIVGVANSIKEPLFIYLFKLSQKHGPIYQIRFGMRNIVVLNTFEYIKTALVENGDALSGRWKAENYIFAGNNAGLFFVDGKVWADQRAFVLKMFRDFGVGRSRSVEIVQDECRHMLQDLEQVTRQRFNLRCFLSLYTLNVISKFVVNKRFGLGNRELQIIQKFLAVVATQKDLVSKFLLMFPFIEKHEWLMKFVMWVTSRTALADDFHRFVEEEVKEHLSRLDFQSEGDDLIDRFLIRQRREKEEKGDFGTFTDWQLVRTAFELIMTGIDSTSITLTWSFMFMSMYPEVQDKVYGEIMDKIGLERMPTMGDKVSLVYTQAVIDEILRLSCITPLSDRHRVLSDITIKDFCIPADTIVVPNLLASHLDPNVWEKPFEFFPEHFLLTTSNGELKYRPREELIVFSMGKRNCFGESLARMEVFVFFISILQKYQVGLVGEKRHFDVFSGSDGIVRIPDVEEFNFSARR